MIGVNDSSIIEVVNTLNITLPFFIPQVGFVLLLSLRGSWCEFGTF